MQASRVSVKLRFSALTLSSPLLPHRSPRSVLHGRNKGRPYHQSLPPWAVRRGTQGTSDQEPSRSPDVQAILTRRENLPDAEDQDEWDSITALEESRRELDWRQQLSDPERWEAESDLDNGSHDPAKLLIHIHASDLELWEELFLYRLRSHGPDGAKMIWRHLDTTVAKSPMRVWERPELWRAVLHMALKDHELLDGLVSHCNKMAAVFSDKPDFFYTDVLKHVLLEHRSRAFYWHTALQHMQPNKFELRKLFHEIYSDAQALESFKTFCFELRAFSDMYSHVVPRLLADDRVDEASDWHDTLLKHGDLPVSFEGLHKAMGRLVKNGHNFVAHKLAVELHKAGVQGGRRWLREPEPNAQGLQRLTPDQPAQSPEIFFSQLPNRQLSDRFIARLIATSFFSVETILAGLAAINVLSIGPLAFRQLLFRIATPESQDPGSQVNQSHVTRAIMLLQQAAVELDSSTFSYLVQQLADNKDTAILQSVLRSDQHPDVLDDVDLQESLLARYVERGNKIDIDRTLAIIRFVKGEAYGNARSRDIANLRLLHAIGRKDKTAALSVVHEIVRDHGRLEATALSAMLYEIMFTPRAKDCRPDTFDELDQVTDFMMNLQKSGYVVPLRAWIELMKRRTWQANISAFKQTLDWKFQWVADRKFRLAQTTSSARNFDWASYYNSWNEKMNYPVPYLEALFSKRMYVYLISIGFAADARKHQKILASGQHQPLSGTHSEKAELLANSTSLWGLRYLASLRQRGLTCNSDHVRKICTSRLTVLFSPRIPRQYVDRQMQMARKANWTDYAAAMERIWGEKLFVGKVRALGQKPSTMTTDSDDPDRLTKQARRLLKRSSLRLRLQAAGWEMSSATASAGRQLGYTTDAVENSCTSNRRDRLRAWHAALPFADTDEYLRTLIPELSATGVLEDDPLLALSKKQRDNLLINMYRRDDEEPSQHFSKFAQYEKGAQPMALQMTRHNGARNVSRNRTSKIKAPEMSHVSSPAARSSPNLSSGMQANSSEHD